KENLSTWFQYVHPDERVLVEKSINEVIISQDQVWESEYRYMKSDSSYAHVANKGIAIKDENGVPYRMIGAMRDITKEKEQYYEIKRIQQNLNSLINNTTDYIWSIDTEMKVIACNNAFSEVIFLLTGKVVVEGTHVLFPEVKKELLDNWNIYYTRALKGEIFTIEEHETLPDNSKRYGIVSFTPITSLDGTVQGVACFGKDISELKKSEERLLELNKELEKRAEELAASNIELERFAYVASHDLQEPLRMVSSFLQLLEKKYEGNLDETAQKYIHFAVDGAARMKVLIKDLLQYSKIGTGALELVPIDINNVLSDILLLFKEEINNSNAEIVVQNMPVILAEKTAMMQLFQNLISNALKYKSPHIAPIVEVSYTEDNHYWNFKVKDNGLGIDPNYNEKIFVIFQRLHNKDEFSGTGIGLAICKKIVERYQGQIRVESEQGAGSTFIFTIAKNPMI
ncbi:MAG: PAS domain-containing protein, partial [Opitutaceae bacterium]|nr:PAS domain-containing protein [Cytophagales bacterium]